MKPWIDIKLPPLSGESSLDWRATTLTNAEWGIITLDWRATTLINSTHLSICGQHSGIDFGQSRVKMALRGSDNNFAQISGLVTFWCVFV